MQLELRLWQQVCQRIVNSSRLRYERRYFSKIDIQMNHFKMSIKQYCVQLSDYTKSDLLHVWTNVKRTVSRRAVVVQYVNIAALRSRYFVFASLHEANCMSPKDALYCYRNVQRLDMPASTHISALLPQCCCSC